MNSIYENQPNAGPIEPNQQKRMQAAPPDTLSEVGYLVVSTGTGGKAYALGDAQVEIYLTDEAGAWQLFRMQNTGTTGIAEKVAIPAPKQSLSQTPDSVYQPYTIARVRVFKDGYYGIEAAEVPIFSGITSLQYFDMIPREESASYQEPSGELTIVSENTENAL